MLAGDGDVDHRLHGGAVEVVVVLQRVGSYFIRQVLSSDLSVFL